MSFYSQDKIIVIDNWNYRGPYVASNTYSAGDAVGSSGDLYVAIQNVPANTAVSDTDYWVSAMQGPRGLRGYPPLIQFSNDALTFYNPPATSLTIGFRYSLDNGATWSNFIRTKGNPGSQGLRGQPGADGADGVNQPMILIQYADRADSSDFHHPQVDGDRYIRFSTDAGTTWTESWKAIGKDGRDGLDVEIQYSVDGLTDWHATETSADQYERARIGDEDPFGPPRAIRGSGAGGISAVASDATLTGSGTTASPLSVANPFTSALQSKLTGIQSGAQVNPLNVTRFSAGSGDTQDSIPDSTIGFRNDTTQIQSGSIQQALHIDIADGNATYGADTASPSTDLDAVDTSRFFDDKLNNGGTFKVALVKRGTTKVIWVQVDQIAAKSGGWRLSALTWYRDTTLAGNNDVWNVVCGTDAIFSDDVVDLIDKLSAYVEKVELAGKESDRYASYNNAFIGGSYRRGEWCLFNQTTVPTDDTNAIGQSSIATGSGVVAFGAQLRTDADPNQLEWASISLATDYSTDDVIYASLDSDKGSYLEISLTSGGTLVSTGDAAFIWATASWIETGDIANVTEAGNYFKLAEYIPSALRFRLWWEDILGAPWVLTDGSNVTLALKNAIQGSNEDEDLDGNFERVASGLASTGDNRYSVSLLGSNTYSITFSVANALTTVGSNDYKLNEAVKLRAWVNIGDHWEGSIEELTTRYLSNNRAQYLISVRTISGTIPAIGQSDTVEIIGEDVHRGQVRKIAFRNFDWADLTSGTPADDDIIVFYDESADEIKKVEKSDLIPKKWELHASNTNLGTTLTNVGATLPTGTLVMLVALATDNESHPVQRTVVIPVELIGTTAVWMSMRGGSNGQRVEYKTTGTTSPFQIQARRQVVTNARFYIYKYV